MGSKKKMPDSSSMSFACLVQAGELENQALLLVNSLRQFGGRYTSAPITLFSNTASGTLSRSGLEAFDRLRVEFRQFDAPAGMLTFPFAAKVLAAAESERLAQDSSQILVWMDTDSLIINEPQAFALLEQKVLGYRPVDHTLIGSRYFQPIDSFWQMVYDACQVPDERLFPMSTSVDQETIRPYFNAGLLVVRPQRGLLRKWADVFSRLVKLPQVTSFYEENPLYRIFIHQAVLSGVILSILAREELLELPRLVNYPLHMHADYPAALRPETLNKIITCRYDPGFSKQEVRELIRIDEPLKSWLNQQLNAPHGRGSHD